MSSLYKIIVRSVVMTALIALLLLVLNFCFTLFWLQDHPQDYPPYLLLKRCSQLFPLVFTGISCHSLDTGRWLAGIRQ